MRKYSLILVALMLTSVGFSQLTTVNISVDKDSYIDTKNPSTNYGSATNIGVGTYAMRTFQYHKRGFVYFDLSSIPAGVEIYSAKIKLKRNGTVSGSNPWLTKRIEDSWGETTITAGNQPTISNDAADISSTYSNSNDTVIFNVSYMAKQMHRGLVDNEGWCIQVTDETSTSTTGVDFYSSESSYMPILEVKYYSPLKLSNVQITHESAQNQDDAVIDLDVSFGSENYTYEWIDGATGSVISTDTLLDSIDYGWYGLHVTGTYGEELYQAFLVGVECDSVNITFESSPEYTSHAYVNNAVVNGVDNKKKNYGNSKFFYTSHWRVAGVWTQSLGYTDFNLWMDDRFNVTKADLELQGNAHFSSNWRTNEAELIQVTSPWNEEVITYNNQPTSSNAIWVEVDSVSTSKQDRTMDISDFWDVWKADNSINYGMKFQLQDFTSNHNVSQNYHSPNANLATDRPVIEFTLDLTQWTSEDVLSSEWESTQETGTIDIDIDRICEKVAPYTYFVSAAPVPNLGDLYTFYKDSVYGGTLDSSAFFHGNTTSTTYSVPNLKKGNYYVAVYDNNWDRIFDDEMRLSGDLVFESQSGLTAQNSTITSSQTDGKGILELYTNEDMNSILEVELTSVSGNQFFGFVDEGSTLTSYQDLEYGLYARNDTVYTVENGVQSSSYTIATSSSELAIRTRNGLVEMFVDGTRQYDKAAPASYAYQAALQIQNTGSVNLYAQEMSGPYKKFWFTSTINNYLTCTTHTGSFSFDVSKIGAPVYLSLSYDVKDESATSVQSGNGSTNSSILVSNVPAGMYTVEWSINGGTTYQETVWFGYETIWDDVVDYVETPNSYSLERQIATSPGNFSRARSENYLPSGQSGWIRFIPKTTGVGQSGNNFLRLTNNYPLASFPSASEEFVHTIQSAGQTRMNYFISGGFDGSLLVPFGTPIAIKHNAGGATEIISSGAPITVTPAQSEEHTIRANTYLMNDGYENVISSYGCPQQLLSEVGYAELKRQVDGTYAHAVEGTLKFTFDEEYDIESNNFVALNIYDDSHALVESIDFANNATNGGVSGVYEFDDRRIDLDISNVTTMYTGEHYTLEVLTSTGEKLYLRFIYKY